MSRFKFKTIFGRMLFIQCASCLLILFFTSFVFFLYLYNSLYSPVYSKLQTIFSSIDTNVLTDDNAEDILFSQADDDIFFEIVSPAGISKSYYRNPYWADFASFRFQDLSVSRVIKKAGETPAYTVHFFPRSDYKVLTLYCCLKGSDTVLLIHTDMRPSAMLLFGFLQWIIIIGAISAIIICVVCFYIAKRVLNPIVEMNHSVKCYSKGDFSQRIDVSGRDEASQLAQSFNEMAEQLRNMDNSRKSFVANVSHELRSPLTSIKGFLEAMQDGTIPQEEHEVYLDIVLSETRRMATMVNDLLDLARIESGMITISFDAFDINELIRRTLITFEALISDKNIELDVRFASDQCFVYADQGQISQVLRNLIDNAIKYSPDGKTLQISTYSLRKEVYIIVKDTGVGIPAEDVPHIFDRFYKVEKAHTPSPQVGSGLGLSIVKKIIEAHGQSITVKSARGKGTQFTFTLQKASLLQIQSRGRKNEE